MTISLQEVLQGLPEERRGRVEQRTEELIAEEMTLREVRRLRRITQANLSMKLKIGQEGVSRIERRSDMNLSTLRSYVEGVGGKLRIMVELPDQPPLILSGLGSNNGTKKAKTKPGDRSRSKAKSAPAA